MKITISDNTTFVRVLFVLVTMSPSLLSIYIMIDTWEKLTIWYAVIPLLITLNLRFTYWLVFRDHTMTLDTSAQILHLKRGKEVVQFDPISLCTLKVRSLGMNLSLGFKYYQFVIDGKTFRVRYILKHPPEKISLFDLEYELRDIEQEIKKLAGLNC